MKHVLIVAHPNEDSFTMAMARAYAAAADMDHQPVLLRDLYRMNFDPCLHADELPWSKGYQARPDVMAERSLIADANVFAFVYPFWFDAPPAILKGYFERVLGAGFGFGPASFASDPLLKGRRMISITSSGAPKNWVEKTGAMASVQHNFDEHIATICGMTVVDHLHFGRIVPGTREDVVGVCAAAVRAAFSRHFGRTEHPTVASAAR